MKPHCDSNIASARDPTYQVDRYQTETSIGFMLGRCVSRITDSIDAALAVFGINSQQFGVLHAIHCGRASSPTELARIHFKYGAAITYLLDGLEKSELLTRQRSTTDRRAIRLELTPKGIALTMKCIPVVVDAQNKLVEDLSHDEHDKLMSLLKKLSEAPSA